MMMKQTIKGKKNVLLIIETSRSFGRGLLRGISHYMLEHDNWDVHVEDRGLLESAPGWLKNWKGDGIISRTSSFAIARAIRRFKVPVVELYGNDKQIVPDIRVDEDQVAKDVVDHFVSLGFKNFAFFAIGNTCWCQFRIEAFKREVSSRGGNLFIFPEAGSGPRIFYPVWEAKYTKILRKWLLGLPKPVAVWGLSDTLAIRLLEGCRYCNIHVPEEVALIGTLNDPVLCNVMTPALSSIDLNSVRMGYVAAQRLDQKMKGIAPEEVQILIPPKGVVARQSTDIVAIPDREVAQVIRLIRQNTANPYSVEQIANMVDLSRSTLQRRFYQYVGRTIEKEILRTRMERAKLLLRETRFSLPSIAAKIGFSSSDYFIQAFRRETGMTPNRYRKQFQFVLSDEDEG